MENIFGIILFIAFMIFRSMSDRKKGMTRGQKAKTTDTMPRSKSKPLVQAEPAGPRRTRPVESKPILTPPPFRALAEGESQYDSIAVMEGTARTTKKAVPQVQPITAMEVATSPVLSYNDLRRAVLWSEILAKPRAMRRSIR